MSFYANATVLKNDGFLTDFQKTVISVSRELLSVV